VPGINVDIMEMRWNKLQTAFYCCYPSCLLYIQSYVPVSALPIPSMSYCRSNASPARAAITHPLLLTVSVQVVSRDVREIDSISRVGKRHEHERERVR
jgi:hypothetical protein